MSETWQTIQERGQQSVGVWGQWNPTFTVGDDTLTILDTRVQALPGAAQAVKTQEDAVDDARAARNTRVALITLLAVQMPRKLDGDLTEEDPYHKDLLDIRGTEITGIDTAQTRGQMVFSLWTKLNARLAAETPAKPALLVGGKTVANLDTAMTELPGKEQAVVNRAEANAKADGTVTRHERKRLHRLQDGASKDIHHQKHDAQAVPKL